MKKRTLKRAIIACTLILTLCLTGCGLFPTNTSKLKQLLEDKYGEEFGVESHYFAGDMWAMCYPESDPTLLFEVRTNAEVTKISHDYYLQTVVQRQVDEEYAPLVEQIFPGSYLSSDISNTLAGVPDTFPKADAVTLDDITEYCEANGFSSDIVLNIFIDTSQMSEENIEAEYAFLKDEIGSRVANGELPDTIIELYFGDSTFVYECEAVLLETTWHSQGDIYDVIENCPHIRIYCYEDGILLDGPKDYDGEEYLITDYAEEKKEVLANE